ncbi:hypothetical protein M0R19_04385 [Candidatus Pacearchaeota archaeon]|nr:hypothetical protein [Candidatus Pacearchaeota archaeon]
MAIKRYIADKDTTITNAYKQDLITLATGSNMGASDSLEIFSIYAQATSDSVEKSRILVGFPVSDIISDRSSGLIGTSGSVEFYLKMYNAKHPLTLPRQFTINVYPLTRDWDEGNGLDMEGYVDEGWGEDGSGATWTYATTGTEWTLTGSDYHTDVYSQYFDDGDEDLSINISDLVEQWVDGTKSDYGVVLRLSGTNEDGSELQSYYTKKFFARGSEYWFKRPIIEARWDDSKRDDRGKFYASCSFLSNNSNTLYLYNFYDGNFTNLPNESLSVKLYDALSGGVEVSEGTSVGRKETGIYTASFVANTLSGTLYDMWSITGTTTCYYTGTLSVKTRQLQQYSADRKKYITKLTNLKNDYYDYEYGKFRFFVREEDWSPTVYSKASKEIENSIIRDMYWKVFRLADDLDIINYGTGSIPYTKMSYDVSGSYFELDMSILEPGYMYGIKTAQYINSNLVENRETFKFRVDSHNE